MLPDMAGISLLHVPLYSSIRREASSKGLVSGFQRWKAGISSRDSL